MKSRPLLLLGCLAVILVPRSTPAAQIFEDPSIPSPVLEFDPSMRSTGMGGGTGAVRFPRVERLGRSVRADPRAALTYRAITIRRLARTAPRSSTAK